MAIPKAIRLNLFFSLSEDDAYKKRKYWERLCSSDCGSRARGQDLAGQSEPQLFHFLTVHACLLITGFSNSVLSHTRNTRKLIILIVYEVLLQLWHIMSTQNMYYCFIISISVSRILYTVSTIDNILFLSVAFMWKLTSLRSLTDRWLDQDQREGVRLKISCLFFPHQWFLCRIKCNYSSHIVLSLCQSTSKH